MSGPRLRKRKMDVVEDKDSTVESNNTSSSSEDESSKSEDEYYPIFTKPKVSKFPKTKEKVEKSQSIEIYEKPVISEYEKIRLQNIAERNELLRSIGIKIEENDVSTTQSKKIKENKIVKKEKKLPPSQPMTMSLRSKAKTVKNIDDSFHDEDFYKEPEPDIDTRNLGVNVWDEDDMVGREAFLEDLKLKINDATFGRDSLNLTTCSRSSFRDVMLSLVINDAPKIVQSRIQSICIHPSTNKRIVLAGSKEGALGIWDVDGSDENNSIELQPCQRSINCITVDNYNVNEIYITSHDGTFTRTDITTKQFINVYATSYDDRINHLTWHDQVDSNTFLVTHGDGDVLVLDKREKKECFKINCFDRSARTVQLYRNQSHYFLAASGGVGNGCGIFDIRSKKEVSHMSHSKGLTGAFFSDSGINIVSTCNDDTVKIWNSQDINKVKLKVSVNHNNHTGRWLSVFRAQWYPGRDDIFYIGSLLQPRRIQMYTDEGDLLTDLRSNDLMSTVQSVLAVHRSLPFVVGGNSSGRVHAFVPPF